MKEGDFERIQGFDYRIVVGYRNMHSMQVVTASNNVFLETRELFCFCCHYIEDVLGDCTSKGYVDPWRLVTLEPCHATNVFCDVEYDENDWGVGEDNNELVAGLRIRDNFAIMAALDNYEGVDFFILQCVKKLHIVDEDSRMDDFGNFVER
jgi:hypothetical protein